MRRVQVQDLKFRVDLERFSLRRAWCWGDHRRCCWKRWWLRRSLLHILPHGLVRKWHRQHLQHLHWLHSLQVHQPVQHLVIQGEMWRVWSLLQVLPCWWQEEVEERRIRLQTYPRAPCGWRFPIFSPRLQEHEGPLRWGLRWCHLPHVLARGWLRQVEVRRRYVPLQVLSSQLSAINLANSELTIPKLHDSLFNKWTQKNMLSSIYTHFLHFICLFCIYILISVHFLISNFNW